MVLHSRNDFFEISENSKHYGHVSWSQQNVWYIINFDV
jgi:hypothetical protein